MSKITIKVENGKFAGVKCDDHLVTSMTDDFFSIDDGFCFGSIVESDISVCCRNNYGKSLLYVHKDGYIKYAKVDDKENINMSTRCKHTAKDEIDISEISGWFIINSYGDGADMIFESHELTDFRKKHGINRISIVDPNKSYYICPEYDTFKFTCDDGGNIEKGKPCYRARDAKWVLFTSHNTFNDKIRTILYTKEPDIFSLGKELPVVE